MRHIVNLDGIWDTAEGDGFVQPEHFAHSAPVPGLLDMATPPFEEIGLKSSKRDAFWYRRTFELEHEPQALNLLRIGKALRHDGISERR